MTACGCTACAVHGQPGSSHRYHTFVFLFWHIFGRRQWNVLFWQKQHIMSNERGMAGHRGSFPNWCQGASYVGRQKLWVVAALKLLTTPCLSYLVCTGLVSLPEWDGSQESWPHDMWGARPFLQKTIFINLDFTKFTISLEAFLPCINGKCMRQGCWLLCFRISGLKF